MKKNIKHLLGFIGLAIVVGATIFAAQLPSPEASAVSSITDTITVRVVGDQPEIQITKPAVDNDTFVNPNQELSYSYANVDHIIATLSVTRTDGTSDNIILADYDTDQQPGDKTIPVNLDNYGYGSYKFTVASTSNPSGNVLSTISFLYTPITAHVRTTEDGLYYDDLNYYVGANSKVARVKVEILNSDGTQVLWSTIVNSPTMSVQLPFESQPNLSTTNTYIVRTTALGADGNPLHTPILETIAHEHIVIPNTGAFFEQLNLAHPEYLLIGIVTFFAIAACLLIFTIRNKRKYRYSRRAAYRSSTPKARSKQTVRRITPIKTTRTSQSATRKTSSKTTRKSTNKSAKRSGKK